MNRDDVAVPPVQCPGCRYRMDSATMIAGDEKVRPRVGDLSICLSCGACLVFGKGLLLRLATHAEVLTLPIETQRVVLAAGRAARELQRQRRRH